MMESPLKLIIYFNISKKKIISILNKVLDEDKKKFCE